MGRNLEFFPSESGLTLAADARAKPPRVMLRSDWSLRRGASVATSEGQTKIASPAPRRPPLKEGGGSGGGEAKSPGV